VASSKSRQRKLARAKMERQFAKRAAKARQRRQVQAGVAIAVAVLLLVFGGLWIGGVFSGSKPTANADCLWTANGTSSVQGIAQPPTTGIRKSGTDTMTIDTNLGTITADIDLAKTPCTGASINYLASKGFYNNVKCSRLSTAERYLLYCGDPVGDGSGGPGYTSIDENVPTPDATSATPSASASATATPSATPTPSATGSASAAPSESASPSESPTPMHTYPRGTVVMAQSGGANTNGSQFFIVYKDTPLPATYTVLGTVTAGMDVVDKVAAGGVGTGGTSTTDGPPNTALTFKTLTVAPQGTSPSTSPSVSPSATASPTASGSANPAASS
jgi:peptidyl-prolyl cis-trans isomerase B (cyclophilin B)